MSEFRYNRVFKKGITAVLCCLILFGSVIAYFIISKIQYNQLVSDMKALDATVIDVDINVRHKGLDWQEIDIEYVVDGTVYNRELKTDTSISFRAGIGAHYEVGDSVRILYDPQNPEIIASPRSVSVGYFWLIFALLSMTLVLFALWWLIKKRRDFLVTQEEYDKEGEEIKEIKLSQKQIKKQRRSERQNKCPKARKFGKIVLLIIASLAALFARFLLFGMLLMALGY